MSELLTVDDFETTGQTEEEEMDEVGSLNHSAIQANLAFLFKRLGTYSVFTELSLDVSNADLSVFDLSVRSELKVDVCLYARRPINPVKDILKMKEMPLLAVEIVSPRQGLYEITEKFKLYFALGVKACWLVIPNTQTVTVYADMDNFHTFVSDEVVDAVLEIHLPFTPIFE
ncbi:MAG: Uma2 family endonuclease [Caldilineaceae bacterium]